MHILLQCQFLTILITITLVDKKNEKCIKNQKIMILEVKIMLFYGL